MSEQRRRVPPPQVSLWPPGHPRAMEYAEQEEASAVMRMESIGESAPKYGRRDGGDSYSDESSEIDSLFESDPEPVTLPESTHTLFFTQPVLSWPFFFASGIVVISVMCLCLALANGIDIFDLDEENALNIPANVAPSVKVAQYLAVIIVLLMEEEIPTGLNQLRSIPAGAFKRAFPGQSYCKFFLATGLRIFMGYVFLVNVFVILAQATGVLEIFYDVLALQFIQQLDDIAFTVAKMEVLGSRLQRACTARLFQTEFDRRKARLNRKASLFLKSLYFLNLVAFIGGLSYVTVKQNRGDYQCKSVQVDFGDSVWEGAKVKVDGGFDERLLVFSTFNGDYVQAEGEQQYGRPIYRERRKFKEQGENGIDSAEPFDDEWVEPAEIKYDKDLEAWVFTHPMIYKSETDEADWLLRSPETDEYDLLQVGGEWGIWVGKILLTKMTFTCNKCRINTDCNLNGECVDGNCHCYDSNDGVEFMGSKCEVKVKKSCATIGAEGYDWVFSKLYLSDNDISITKKPGSFLFQQYNRPVYSHIWGLPNRTLESIDWLVYTGRRWIYVGFNLIEMNFTQDDVILRTKNFHAFWSRLFYFGSENLILMSDPTTGDIPVGVDWYWVSEHDGDGGQFGPFGALTPIQKDGLKGRGFWGCTGSAEELLINAALGSNTSETNATAVFNATSGVNISGNNTSN